MWIGFSLAVVFLALAMAGAWGVQRITGNAGWVDCIWSVATGVGGVMAALMPDPASVPMRQIVVAALIAIWSLRLGLHIARRSASGPEDARYAALRVAWGERFQVRLFWFLQIQAAAAALLVLSMALAAHNPAPSLRIVDGVAVLVLLVSVLGEGVADAQLRRFRANRGNRDKVCDVGLWNWSRHPNYFFEWLGWLAYPLLAVSAHGWWWGWLALSGPALMYWLLVHVSGVPPLERHMLHSRGDRYRAYQDRVSAFFPSPPKRRQS